MFPVLLALTFALQSPPSRPARAAANAAFGAMAARLFDTGTPSHAPLSAKALARRVGWTELPEGQTAHRFQGDAVLVNGRLAVVLRWKGRGAEVHSVGPKGPTRRAVLVPLGGTGNLTSVKALANDPGRVAVEAAFQAEDGKALTLRYELQVGQVFVKTAPGGDAAKARRSQGLCVEAPCRFAVLPDFFADDIVADAAALPVAEAEVPGENSLLHLLGDGEAIVMAVWDSRGEDVRIALSGQGRNRRIDASRIRYGAKGSIGVAVLEEPGIWHTRDVAKADAGKATPLDWHSPFPAHWRVDWTRDDGLTDSWEMLTQQPNGTYVKHGWYGQPESFGNPDWMKPNRGRWTTVLGSFQYPCWIDKAGQGHLQPLKKGVRSQGPAIIYPINRLATTPLDRFTVVDLMRATLGVGPCEYILDVEGQKKAFHGAATCASRTKLDTIYSRGEQKQKRAEVEKALDDVLAFVQHIRGRITDYVTFGREMLAYLAEQKKAHPELADRLAELETLTREIDVRVARREARIRPPAYAAGLVGEFRKTLIDYEGSDALERCKRITKALVEIGGNQDELVGECRVAVRILRQRAALAMALDPRMADIASEIRRRTHQVLRNPASYEAPRH